MVSVTVDNINIQISPKSTVLEACHFAGIIVPRFCFHKKLSIAGNCRMCIVEIEKFPKPVSSCTLKVTNGMKVFTKTPLVRKAQETVLEFLLINHPLDCPICDQGGECDLQDQLNFFGSDSSRYFKFKRGVSDKNCGPFVKTIMTRCIHCTRCIRFLSELGGQNSFGMLGRSSKSEIGLYISDNLKSEFSGNVIDLCPVGALTSKPYSFKGRSWELINYRTVDILDSLNSDIVVSLKGFDVLRILPCFTAFNASEWISDKTRFFYDSFDFFRIKKCWLKKRNNFIDWFYSLTLLRSLFLDCQKNKKKLGIFLGALSDLETVILSKHLGNIVGSSDIYSDFNCEFSGSLDFRSNYSFNSFESLEKCDLCLILGSDLRSEASSLNLVIKKRVLEGSLQVGYIGPSIDMLYPYKHLGLGFGALMSLFKGKHPFSLNLKKSKNLSIIIGERFNYGNIYQLVSKLSSLKYLDSLNLANINVLRTKSSSIAFSEVGINSLKLNKKFDLLILIGVDDLKFYRLSNPDSFIIYIGSHFSVYNLELADLILPASLFLEKDFTIINLENRIKTSKALRKVSGDIRSEYFLLLVLISFLNNNLNLGELKKNYMFDQLFIKEYPFIAKNNFKIAEFLLGEVNNSTLRNGILGSRNFNFYEDNSVIRSSRNFKYCLNNLKKIQFRKKNVV